MGARAVPRQAEAAPTPSPRGSRSPHHCPYPPPGQPLHRPARRSTRSPPHLPRLPRPRLVTHDGHLRKKTGRRADRAAPKGDSRDTSPADGEAAHALRAVSEGARPSIRRASPGGGWRHLVSSVAVRDGTPEPTGGLALCPHLTRHPPVSPRGDGLARPHQRPGRPDRSAVRRGACPVDADRRCQPCRGPTPRRPKACWWGAGNGVP